jgi:hypothetical protein
LAGFGDLLQLRTVTVYEQLDELVPNLVRFRETTDRIFSKPPKNPAELRRYFFDMLVCTSQLYLDYLFVLKDSPSYEANRTEAHGQKLIGANNQREIELRKRFQRALASSPHWKHFVPENPFSDETGLRTLDDYLHRFSHHLPEIYEETFRIESYIKIFLENRSEEALAGLLVGLLHMGRHHISFVQQALEWAADDISWP